MFGRRCGMRNLFKEPEQWNATVAIVGGSEQGVKRIHLTGWFLDRKRPKLHSAKTIVAAMKEMDNNSMPTFSSWKCTHTHTSKNKRTNKHNISFVCRCPSIRLVDARMSSVILYVAIDAIAKRILFWQKTTTTKHVGKYDFELEWSAERFVV